MKCKQEREGNESLQTHTHTHTCNSRIRIDVAECEPLVLPCQLFGKERWEVVREAPKGPRASSKGGETGTAASDGVRE